MQKNTKHLTLILLAVLPCLLFAESAKKKDKTKEPEGEITRGLPGVLWREPANIASRDVFNGPGGKQHQPHGAFKFVKEDLEGSNPKFVVEDQDGVKWKVKLGAESKPETAASRIVWAVGYYANEDYYLPTMAVKDVPSVLHRGKQFIDPDGTMHEARLKRDTGGEKKIGIWKWRDNPFVNTREEDGLRVLMAVINNWDLKDLNNAVYETKHGESGQPELIYMVSDLGASFGPTGLVKGHEKSRGYLAAYQRSRFIRKIHGDEVDFDIPHRAAIVALVNPPHFFMRLGLRWIGRNIPRQDAKWLGERLAQLSPDQLRDAFRAAGYSPQEVEGFASVLQSRIAQLTEL